MTSSAAAADRHGDETASVCQWPDEYCGENYNLERHRRWIDDDDLAAAADSSFAGPLEDHYDVGDAIHRNAAADLRRPGDSHAQPNETVDGERTTGGRRVVMLGGEYNGAAERNAPEVCDDGVDGRLSFAVVPRRRAVDASDLRSCALVQTQMKAMKLTRNR